MGVEETIHIAVRDVDAAFEKTYPESGFSEDFVLDTIVPFIRKLGGSRVVDNMYKACLKIKNSPADTIKYFCGICHNQIRSANNVVPRRPYGNG